MSTITRCDKCEKLIDNANEVYVLILKGVDYDLCSTCHDRVIQWISDKDLENIK